MIAIDIDGILCDFDRDVWRPAFRDVVGRHPAIIDSSAYHMHLRYDATEEECAEVWANNPAIIKHMLVAPPIPEAVTEVNGLSTDVAILLTARGTHGTLTDSEPVRSATRRWVSRVFGGHRAPKTLFVPADDKVSFCYRNGITTLYEDKPSTIRDALDVGMTVYSLKWDYNSEIHNDERVAFLDWSNDGVTSGAWTDALRNDSHEPAVGVCSRP